MSVRMQKAKNPSFIASPADVISIREHKKRSKEMGLVYADIELISSDDLALQRRGFIQEDEVKRLELNMLVDSGAEMLTINEHIKNQLGLAVLAKTSAQLADGTEIQVDVAGPIELRFENRRATVDALVMPADAEVLLGAIPLQEMDVMIEFRQERLVVNPKNPYKASKYVK